MTTFRRLRLTEWQGVFFVGSQAWGGKEQSDFLWACQSCAELPYSTTTDSVQSVRYHTPTSTFLLASMASLWTCLPPMPYLFLSSTLSLADHFPHLCPNPSAPLWASFTRRIGFWQRFQKVSVTSVQFRTSDRVCAVWSAHLLLGNPGHGIIKGPPSISRTHAASVASL